MLITMQGRRAAQVGNPGHYDPKDVEDFDQLPTPRDTPQRDMPSDSLFSITDMPIDSNDTNVPRTRTADSGNPLFTIVDRSGIFNIEIIFCVCPDGGKEDAQLIQSGLFPATFKQIETVFTHTVLDDFLRDNLECKTTAQQYYSKLQMMTSKMFPNTIPVRFCFPVIHSSNTGI
jgi:CxC2 like cysteine cluster associated with KDZ transposases